MKPRKLKKLLERIRSSKTAFKIGIFLLVVNIPLGWMGIVVGSYLSAHFKNPRFHILSGILYGLTWVMLGVGIILAGPKGIEIAKKKLRFWKR